MQPLPGPFALPLREVVIADPPRRQVLGHHAPGYAAADQIEDPVEHATFAVARRAAHLAWTGYHRFQYAPFPVGEIAVVAFFFHRLPIMGSDFQKALTK